MSLSQWKILLAHLVLLFAAVTASQAAAAAAPRVLKAASVPSSWKNVGTAPAQEQMQFSLYLNSPNRAGLATQMTAISKDPNAKWLTQDQLAQYVTPTTSAQQTVVSALTGAGIPAANISFSGLKDRVIINSTVALAQKFLGTTLSSYSHDGKDAVPKATNVTLPASIAAHVYSVGTLLAFGDYSSSAAAASVQAKSLPDPAPRARRRRLDEEEETRLVSRASANISSNCYSSGGHVYSFPRCLIDQYGLPVPKKSLRRRNDLAVVGYLGENMSQNDLTKALTQFRPDQPNASKYKMTVNDLFGASNNASNPTSEAALDAQIIAGMAFPLQTSYYNIGDSNGNTVGADDGDIFLTAFQTFIDQDASIRPQVVAVSYGILDEDSMGATADAMCNAAQVLSALGTTIIFASGDSGPDSVARAFNPSYPDNGGYCPSLRPAYPVGCPYITTVGATAGWGDANEQPVYYNTPSGLTGTKWSWASGSGFSRRWSTPSWQADALKKALSASNALYDKATSGQFNSAGRAYPDVVTNGIDFPIVLNNAAYLQAGTSMSAPVFGAVVAVLNDALLNAGKATVGWMNPMLYANPGAFNDVKVGGSYWKCGAGTEATAQQYGFNSTAGGYDIASGLGSPDYAKLKSIYGL
ncbi:subtilisin-like protein [Jaminaea rosea]|uniref:Subtilisin-like protein n=1 Tax=Jaminaea rosea TaxID=1569628 RepID=A0A316UYA3_9BASI|nr:subtilisin-like protein [Jaminaea rosea]PWN29291.1 subtilisin-like protein [Jaminaea rosea]